MSTKHLDMIRELNWNDEKACKELGCTTEEFDRSKNDIGLLPLHSAYILCDKYNAIISPAKPVTLDQLAKG